MTVQEMLQLVPTSLMKVSAGLNGLDRQVTQVGIMDAPDIADWVKPGEFVVTTGYALHDDIPEFCRLISRLAEANCSGFGLKIHRYWEEFPEAVRSLGNDLKFPLIEISSTVNLADIVDSIQFVKKSTTSNTYLGGTLSFDEFLLRLRSGHLSIAQIRFWAEQFHINSNVPIVAFELKDGNINDTKTISELEKIFGRNITFHVATEHVNLSVGFVTVRHESSFKDLWSRGKDWKGSKLYFGTIEPSILEYSLSARKAEITRYIGSVVRPFTNFVMYEDIASLAILHKSLDVERTNSIIDKTILQIIQYDHIHHSDWFSTLAAYLDCDKNAQQAARLLNAHKNTVIYRLTRLEEYFHISLNDMATTFTLYLGLLLYRLQHLTMD